MIRSIKSSITVAQAEQVEIKAIVAGTLLSFKREGEQRPLAKGCATQLRVPRDVADTLACPTKRGKPATCSLQSGAGSLKSSRRSV
jgi:hypothetical protein